MGRVHLFIVRVDRDAPGFQASARRVDEEAVGSFDKPQTLLEFLVGQPPDAPEDWIQSAKDAPTAPPGSAR